MKARVKWVDGVCFVAETGSGHAVVVDGAPDSGGRNLGMRPMETPARRRGRLQRVRRGMDPEEGTPAVADCVVEAEADRAAIEPGVFTGIRLTFRVAGRGSTRARSSER